MRFGKKIIAVVAITIVLSILFLPVSLAVDTSYRNGTVKTIKHFRIYTPNTNDLTNGKPLIVFFATDEQAGSIRSVLWLINKYHIYDNLDVNLMCVSFANDFTMKGWAKIGEELADYLKTEYEQHPVDIIIDGVSNGGYGGCCLAQELINRDIIPKELNLGDGIVKKLISSDWIRSIAEKGTQVNLYASSSRYFQISINSKAMVEELDGMENFHGEIVGKIKHIEVLWKAISEHGLHSEYAIEKKN